MNPTPEQVAEARRIIAAAEQAEREAKAQTERDVYAELAAKMDEVKQGIRDLHAITTKASAAGVYMLLNLSDIVEVINDYDSTNTYRNDDWYYSSSC